MSLRYNMVCRIILIEVSVYFHNRLFYRNFHTIFHFLNYYMGKSLDSISSIICVTLLIIQLATSPVCMGK